MGIQFCKDCGDTLPLSQDAVVKCDCCEELNQNTLLSTSVISTSNKFPSRLRDKLTSTIQILTTEEKQHIGARTNKKCPACEMPELTFSEAQLRGADEGSTLFYYCLNCKHRFKEDN